MWKNEADQIVKDVNWAIEFLQRRGLKGRKGLVAAMVLNTYLKDGPVILKKIQNPVSM